MTTRPTAESVAAQSRKNVASWNRKLADERIVDRIKESAIASREIKPSKMRNKKVQTPQGAFSSVREWRRYGELLLMVKSGDVVDLQRQVKFSLDVNNVHICDYVADFTYITNIVRKVVEDVKPNFKTEASRKKYQATFPYRIFKMKKLLMLAVHRIDVREV